MSIEIHDKSPKIYIVLGMHRSGTSFVSKAIHDQGISMGENIDLTHYEDPQVVGINSDLINGDWMRLPLEDDITKNDVSSKIRSFIDSRRGYDKWGFKDPRTSVTVDKWLAELNDDDDVYLICLFRRPRKVVDSLLRSGFRSGDDPLGLVREYNRRLIRSLRGFTGVDG